MTDNNMFKWEQDSDGIVTLTMDDPNQSANTMNDTFNRDLPATVERVIAEKDNITGVIITSAKKTFFAGAELSNVIKATPADAEQLEGWINEFKAATRKLETLGIPVVAAINGAALGGGLEIALATHHRVALDAKGSQLGLPEVTLGLLPGGGGVARTVRMFGLEKALMQILLQGQRRKPAAALEVGLIDELADSPEDMIAKAKAWIKANPEAQQPWDVKGYKIPGGTPSNPKFAAMLPAFPANLRKQIKGAPMPAPPAIMAAAVEGSQVGFDDALKIETRYFVYLACGPVSKNMIQAFFFDLQGINKGAARPEGYEKWQGEKIVVLGAGMMGAGIAYVSALAGMEVVLKDMTLEAAQKGKGYSEKLVAKAVKRGKMTQEKADELLARILPTDNPADAKDANIFIEAVFENPDVKKKVYAEIEPFMAPDALLASNTSTLPITGLSEGVTRPGDFIGLHFFSPVDKMPLLEIVMGEKTSDAALAKAIDYTLMIRKTPIVVNDSRGFFTSRTIGTFMNEAVAMVAEGLPAASIEQAALQAGYPTGPLALSDEVTLRLNRMIREEFKTGLAAEGKVLPPHPADPVVDKMVLDFERIGRVGGAGFYDYDDDGKRVGLWAGLAENWGGKAEEPAIPFKDMQERMLFIEALESVKCLDENVLRSVPEANIGSIFGIGFPPWTGGVLQYINGYEGGPAGFVARAKELEAKYGDRFEVPESLEQLAASGGKYE